MEACDSWEIWVERGAGAGLRRVLLGWDMECVKREERDPFLSY